MGYLEKFLENVGAFQKKYTMPIFICVILISVFMIIGMTKVEMQTDMTKEMPQELPIFKLNERIRDKFGGQDVFFVVLTIDENSNINDGPIDARDPRIIAYLSSLGIELGKESTIDRVVSAGTYLSSFSFSTTSDVMDKLETIPAAKSFFSRDYKTTTVLINVDIGKSEQKIIQMTNLIREKINSVPRPSGVKIMVTGSPPMRYTIFNLLKHDAVFTISLASLIILFLLFFTEKSITKGFLVFVPLLLGLIWTMGTMGWIGMRLSIATVGLGAMILGLGVEYGVFMYVRYKEERDKGIPQLESLKISVPAVGIAVIGSGLTTIVGFGALMLSFMPMLQHLGAALALGITYCLIAAIFVSPVIFLLEEDFEEWLTHLIYKKASENKKIIEKKKEANILNGKKKFQKDVN